MGDAPSEEVRRALHAAYRKALREHHESLEKRARVMLMFFRADQIEWEHHLGPDSPRIRVEVRRE